MDGKRRPTVLITGCSAGGLGESLALAFQAKDYRVFATSRTLDSMQVLQEGEIETFELDVTSAEDIANVRDSIVELTGGRLDILVNNAGQSHPQAVSDTSLDKARQIFDVNFFGALAMTQAFLPLLMVSSQARVIQLGSLSGVIPTPFGVAYNASKAALHSLSDTLRVELAPFNIKIINVVLGNVQTHITNTSNRLPDNSVYLPIKDIYQSRRIDHFHDGAYPRQPVADAIVSEALKDHPPAWWWGGKNAWVTWFLYTFIGRRFMDWLLSRIFGLNKLAALRARDRKAT